MAFVVMDAFLARSDIVLLEHCPGNYYIVEPRRKSTTVHRFTGTLGQGSGSDKPTNTILAFNHWVVQNTACQLSFADIQGKYLTLHSIQYSRYSGTCATVGNEMAWVLFDPMIHTCDGCVHVISYFDPY